MALFGRSQGSSQQEATAAELHTAHRQPPLAIFILYILTYIYVFFYFTDRTNKTV